MLYENKQFKERNLAALVASKVYYHLGSFDNALQYALGADKLFNVDESSEYVETIITKCIDHYTKIQVDNFQAKDASEIKAIDPRLEDIVNRMFQRFFDEKKFKQVIGLAIETRRLDVFEKAISVSINSADTIAYAYKITVSLISNRKFRNAILRLLVKLYKSMSNPDYVNMVQCLIYLDEPEQVANILENLIRSQEPPAYIKDADFSYVIDRPYQDVQHHLVKLKGFSEQLGKSRISLTFSSQLNIRKEFDITRSETELPQLQLNLLTNMADLVWEHFGDTRLKGSMGLNIMHQQNAINYRYFIPNYQGLDFGFWIAEKYKFKQWQVEGGLRYDYRARFAITDNDKAPFDLLIGNALVAGDPYGKRNFNGLSGTGVIAYTFNENLRVSITAATAWRAPQMNELFSNGLHHGAARIERGDPTINPERAYSLLGNVLYNNNTWEIDFGIYNKVINDFIYLKPTYPPLLTIRGAFPAFDFAQTDAVLTGSDINIGYKFNNHLRSHIKASLLRAYDRGQNTWLIQMPSDRYEADLNYVFVDGKKLKQPSVKISYQYVTEQKRVPPSGNIKVVNQNGQESMESDYMAPPPAYGLVNFEAAVGMELMKKKIDLVLGVTNLFNVAYRDYMNAFRYFALDRGRNISLKIKMPF
jgi:iron complex outermembrane receptor protein